MNRVISRVRTLYRVTTKLGISHTARLFREKLFPGLPTSTEVNLEKLPGVLQISSENLLELKFPSKSQEINSLEGEYLSYLEEFSHKQLRPRKDFFESIFDLGPGLGKFLYIAIRLERPSKVIETGVAAGASTNTVLTAIRANGIGSLTSIDVTPKVGELVDQELRELWDFQVINPSKAKEGFLTALRANRDASFFLHDSDHALEWQMIELNGVHKELIECNIVAFDDVSTEFLENLKSRHPQAEVFLVDEGRKYSAVVFFNDRISGHL